MTLCGGRNRLPLTIELARDDRKAVKIGHGPATVIGRRRAGCGKPKVRNVPGLVEAAALREREPGDGPRHFREAFLLE